MPTSDNDLHGIWTPAFAGVGRMEDERRYRPRNPGPVLCHNLL
ncbi:hypothetical protein [uncultured Sphingomonas sp.]